MELEFEVAMLASSFTGISPRAKKLIPLCLIILNCGMEIVIQQKKRTNVAGTSALNI